MRQTREVARRRRQADPDETDVVVPSARAAATVIISDALYVMAVTPASAALAGAFANASGAASSRVLGSTPGMCRDLARSRPRPGRTRCRARSSRARTTDGAARHDRDGAHRPRRQDHGVGAAPSKRVHDLLDRDDRPSRREHGFLLHADDPFDQHVALAIGFLRVDDRDVGPERRHGCELLAGERAATNRMFGFTSARSEPR